MIPSQLKSRTKFIEATPIKDRATTIARSRREPNKIEDNEETEFAETFESFFDYEKELGEMKPAGEQFANTFLDEEDSGPSFVVMEDLKKNPTPTVMAETKKDKKINFKQCSKVIEEGRQCKRQAPKTSDFCAAHRSK